MALVRAEGRFAEAKMRLRSRSDILLRGILTSLVKVAVDDGSTEDEGADISLCGGDEGGGEGKC